MRLATPALAAVLAFALGACSSTTQSIPVTPPPVTQTIPISYGSVELRKVSLPTYAASDELARQESDGAVVSKSNLLWADSPERAVGLELSRNLTRLTGRRVASEPWPFESFPDARLEVRFESLLPGADGVYRSSGQFFVAPDGGGRERSGLFDLSVRFDPEGGPQAIAAARGQIILDLAEYIARNGLR